MARYYAKNRTPTTPADLARCLTDPHAAAELLGGSPEEWSSFEREYAANSRIVDTLATERAQLIAQEELRANGGRNIPHGIGGTAGNSSRGRFYNRRALGARLDGIMPETEFPFAQFVSVCHPANDAAQPIRAAMSERVPAEGGQLIPELMRSNLLELTLEHAIVRPRARLVPMDSLRVPYPAIDDPSHANATSVYGGVTGNWTEEAAALPSSAPSFARLVLEAKKLTLYSDISNEVLADAGQLLEDWLRTEWPAALAWYEDDAMINGTGAGQPQGFLNAPAAIKVSAGTAHTIVLSDVIGCYTRMLPQALPGAVWLASPEAVGQLLQMALTANSTTIAPPSWMTNMQVVDDIPTQLFGHELIISEKMPTSGSTNTTTAGALSFCNFQYYLLGDRQEMRMAVSQEYRFATDQTSYRVISREDGRVWPQSALTPRNSGPTLSPFVLLDTTS